jgi:formylmethanofuran dehydrogenase subunit B
LSEQSSTQLYENVTCPFCGILCDDLRIERTGNKLKVLNKNCGQSAAGFQRELPPAAPMLQGKEVSFEEAIKAAAGLLAKAKLPLFGGLSTDVDGIRAALALADISGGVADHGLSEAQFRNFSVLQRSGWIMTTLTEARNRADLFVIVGTDVHKLHTRFFERIVCPPDAMFGDTSKRSVVFIGEGLDTSGAVGPRVGDVVTLPVKPGHITEFLLALRARINGTPLGTPEPEAPKRTGILSTLLPHLRSSPVAEREIAGIKLSQIDALAERCKAARYGVMVWAPPGLSFPQADLAVQAISDIVRDLNVTTRFAGLSLGGNEGAVTAAGVTGWQTGYPSRVSFASGAPRYDVYRNSIGRMLAANEGDLLVWIASITPNFVPPETRLPKIVLGTPGFRGAEQATVYIPVGTSGIDHAGLMIRVDNVVSLPMHDLGRSRLPRVADVLAAIQAAL